MRKENESDFDYGIRLIKIKIEDKPDNLEWQDIVDLLGLDIHRDTLRKSVQSEFGGYNVYKYMLENMKNNIADDDILKQIDEKTKELKKERYKLQTEKLEYNNIFRQKGRDELIVEKVRDSINAISPPTFQPLQISKNKRGYLLGISDTHYSKQFTSLNNEYSIEIFKDRMNYLLYSVLEFVDENNVEELNIVNCADNIENMLRIQTTSLQTGVIDSVIEYSRYMSEWLNELSSIVRVKYYHISRSNHSQYRILGSKAGNLVEEDFEKIIFAYIHDTLKDNKRIEIPEFKNNFVKFDVCGYKILALHGDGIKNIKTALHDLTMLHREFFDTLYLGHFHHGQTVAVGEGSDSDIEIRLVPSFMGSDGFSDKLLKGAKASVIIDVYEEGKGRIQENKIILN